MARTLTTQDVSWFLDLHGKGQLNLTPSYQRRSVWSPRDKRYFIDTILNQYPAPPVFLHKTIDDNGRSTYHVVDGKQRLQTIIEFSEGKVRIPDNFSDVTLQKKRWNDLGPDVRKRFWNYVLIAEMLPDVSDAMLRNIFERINRNSRKLTPQEMRHAKYDGWFITTAEAEAEKQEWKDFRLATAARMKRMADVQFISELLGTIIRQEIAGFDQDALDDLYAEYEDLSEQSTFIEEDFLMEVERLKSKIHEALTIEPVLVDFLKVQSHFYTLWGYMALEKARLIPVAEFTPKYFQFMRDARALIAAPEAGLPAGDAEAQDPYLQAVADYAANTRGASTDLRQRLKRRDALLIAIHGAEGVAHENNQAAS